MPLHCNWLRKGCAPLWCEKEQGKWASFWPRYRTGKTCVFSSHSLHSALTCSERAHTWNLMFKMWKTYGLQSLIGVCRSSSCHRLRHKSVRMDRHLKDTYTELSQAQVKLYLQQVKRTKTTALLAALRASNPFSLLLCDIWSLCCIGWQSWTGAFNRHIKYINKPLCVPLFFCFQTNNIHNEETRKKVTTHMPQHTDCWYALHMDIEQSREMQQIFKKINNSTACDVSSPASPSSPALAQKTDRHPPKLWLPLSTTKRL